MIYFLSFLLMIAIACCAWLYFKWQSERASTQRFHRERQQERTTSESRIQALEQELEKSSLQIKRLAKWETVADAVDRSRALLASAKSTLSQANADAQAIMEQAKADSERLLAEANDQYEKEKALATKEAKQKADEAKSALLIASHRASEIITEANRKAEEIAGKAYDAVRNAELYEKTAKAMKNIIKGYGDEYLKPAASLLDDLAKEFDHKDAGRQLQLARSHTMQMIKEGRASQCEYVASSRREGAERFVLDAFNGKVDSILSRVKHDNYGILEQEILDAFTIVNFGGKAFREARITEEFLAARIGELKWASIAQELKRKSQEEQRQFREWIREEKKVQREIEKAIRESAKEEELLRKAMLKAQAHIAEATEEQRTKYEAELAELSLKLKEAEERNQRAMSMAQQTRRGHVYIISNIGSFGENVYKIGLTRRLEPLDRIKELGDASVPFAFDVHAIILSDDAPALETQLHKHFILNQLNKVNHRKEFFRARLADIRREIESMDVETNWTMVAEAQEYRETLAIERAIESDATARDAWLNRQLTLDPVNQHELDGDPED